MKLLNSRGHRRFLFVLALRLRPVLLPSMYGARHVNFPLMIPSSHHHHHHHRLVSSDSPGFAR